MHSKKSRTGNVKTCQWLEVNAEARRILRTVNTSESFHFYEAIGKPTGQHTSNLKEFLETVRNVKAESLRFHLERKDFQNWIEKTLGDTTLARRITRIGTKDVGTMRTEIQSTLEKRIKELAGPTLTVTADTEQALARREVAA